MLLAAPSRGAPQNARAATRIQVRNSSGGAAPGVAIRVVRGLKETVAAATTDSAGRAVVSIHIPVPPTDHQLGLRHIGYEHVE